MSFALLGKIPLLLQILLERFRDFCEVSPSCSLPGICLQMDDRGFSGLPRCVALPGRGLGEYTCNRIGFRPRGSQWRWVEGGAHSCHRLPIFNLSKNVNISPTWILKDPPAVCPQLKISVCFQEPHQQGNVAGLLFEVCIMKAIGFQFLFYECES